VVAVRLPFLLSRKFCHTIIRIQQTIQVFVYLFMGDKRMTCCFIGKQILFASITVWNVNFFLIYPATYELAGFCSLTKHSLISSCS
jgi:hypothetical protein